MNTAAPTLPGSRGLIVLLGSFLMLQPLSTDMYLASLPGLVARFSTSVATVQLTLSVFILGFGIMQLVSGPLSDRFGRRPVILAGLSLYVAATLACAAAPSVEALIVARFAQAVGCCTAVVVARAIVRDVYGPIGSARALAQALTVLALGPIFGPLLGAALEVSFGHVAIFLALATFAAVLLALTARRLTETNDQRDPDAIAPGRVLRQLPAGAALARVQRLRAARRGQLWRAVRLPVVVVLRVHHGPPRADGLVRRACSRA